MTVPHVLIGWNGQLNAPQYLHYYFYFKNNGLVACAIEFCKSHVCLVAVQGITFITDLCFPTACLSSKLSYLPKYTVLSMKAGRRIEAMMKDMLLGNTNL